MEVLGFFEFFELAVYGFGFGSVGVDGQVFLIFLIDEISEFLFDQQLCDSFFQSVAICGQEFGQFGFNFFVVVEVDDVFGVIECCFELIEQLLILEGYMFFFD